MQDHKADSVPQGLVQERRLHIRQRTVDVDAHAQEGIRDLSVGLLVDEVAPAADRLADQKPHRRDVEHRAEADAPHLAEHDRRQDARDDRAVDRDAAVPDAEHRHRVVIVQLVVFPDDVICARADDRNRHREQQQVDEVIRLEADIRAALHAVQDAEQEADGDDDPVPVHMQPADRERDPIDGKAQTQSRKGYGVLHDSNSSVCFFLTGGSIVSRAVRRVNASNVNFPGHTPVFSPVRPASERRSAVP